MFAANMVTGKKMLVHGEVKYHHCEDILEVWARALVVDESSNGGRQWYECIERIHQGQKISEFPRPLSFALDDTVQPVVVCHPWRKAASVKQI